MILYCNEIKIIILKKRITIWNSKTLLGIHAYELEKPDTVK
jgi:hypothetical protein